MSEKPMDRIRRLFELREVEPIDVPTDVDMSDPAAVRAWMHKKIEEDDDE